MAKTKKCGKSSAFNMICYIIYMIIILIKSYKIYKNIWYYVITIHIRKINIHTTISTWIQHNQHSSSSSLLSARRIQPWQWAKIKHHHFLKKALSILVKGVQYMFIDNPKQKTPNPKLKDTIIECSIFIFKKNIFNIVSLCQLFRSPKLTRTERNFNMKIFVVSRCFNKTSGRAFQLLLVSIAFQSGSPTWESRVQSNHQSFGGGGETSTLNLRAAKM